MSEEKRPEVFISYGWSTADHGRFVIDFATELQIEWGIKVIFDRWHLKEGHDKYQFMEESISKSDVKVIMICDSVYCEKANIRKGGVGTEAQIITTELYENSKQDKFVAVVVEKDEKDLFEKLKNRIKGTIL
ncbi:toll/interleukin-1 receptor domain-containing protein [Leptospira weilii]|uniref:toll/interleukin-1 receptor domain-containing protein n=1 Tax=Leptospira weilii TaxID=28184 RepID=UPI00037998A5|nr:toll/interleukin-1 receptor domain-containing protein [Leptospira weilii]OMI16712.1 hypothetical protein BUQ74_14065 [Leptospira weilii serovar Heyan]